MKKRDFLIFFTTVLTIYSLANIYLYKRGLGAMDGVVSDRIYFWAYLLLASTFVAGKVLERTSSSVIVDILNVTGGFWLALLLYASILFILSDILFFILKLSGVIEVSNLISFRKLLSISVLLLSLIIMSAGFFNSVIPRTRNYNVEIDKPVEGGKIKIAAVSDVHLGSIIRKRSLRVLSRMLSESDPDLIFFLGDLVDGEINPVIRDDLLKSLTLPETAEVYAITGNHEYIGGIGKTLPYYKRHKLKVLIDETVTTANGIEIIGRADSDSVRFTGKKRMDLGELISLADPSKPIILLDHQPLKRNFNNSGGYDLMLSGHTHNGQMWPFNYIVNLIYKHSYGCHKYNGISHIISSGFGTWGPRIRIGSRAEIVTIDLNGSNMADGVS